MFRGDEKTRRIRRRDISRRYKEIKKLLIKFFLIRFYFSWIRFVFTFLRSSMFELEAIASDFVSKEEI